MATPYALTVDGYETQWQTNYLSHFLLIKALLPTLSYTAAGATSSGRVRIVNVSSDAAFVPFAPALDLDKPNLEYIKGIMAAWCISPVLPSEKNNTVTPNLGFILSAKTFIDEC